MTRNYSRTVLSVEREGLFLQESVKLISKGDAIRAVINLTVSPFDLPGLGSVSKAEGKFWWLRVLPEDLGWEEGATEAYTKMSMLKYSISPAVLWGVSAIFFWKKSFLSKVERGSGIFSMIFCFFIDASTGRIVILFSWTWISFPSSLDEIWSHHISVCILQCVLEEVGDTVSPSCGLFHT